MKYSLSTRKIPRKEPKGFSEGLGYISLFIQTQVVIQTYSISLKLTSSVKLPGRAILEESILRINMAAGAYFSVLHSRQSNTDQEELNFNL